MGGRRNEVPTKVGSSIILLQERFKQLQKLKKMRQERQLLQLLPQSTDGYNYEEGVNKLRKSCSSSEEAGFNDPLALGLNSNSYDITCYQEMKRQRFASDHMKGVRNFVEKHDVVDTSLRL